MSSNRFSVRISSLNVRPFKTDFCSVPNPDTSKNEESPALCSCLLGHNFRGEICHEVVKNSTYTLLSSPPCTKFPKFLESTVEAYEFRDLLLEVDLVFNRLVHAPYPRSTESPVIVFTLLIAASSM